MADKESFEMQRSYSSLALTDCNAKLKLCVTWSQRLEDWSETCQTVKWYSKVELSTWEEINITNAVNVYFP